MSGYFWFILILGLFSLVGGLMSFNEGCNGNWVGYICGAGLILAALLCFFLAYKAYARKKQSMVTISQKSALCNKGAFSLVNFP